MGPQDLEQYVEWVLSEKEGYDTAMPEVKAELKNIYLDALENQVNAAIIQALPEDKLPEFDQLLEKDDDALLASFCEQHVPNMREVVAAALVNFKENYAGA